MRDSMWVVRAADEVPATSVDRATGTSIQVLLGPNENVPRFVLRRFTIGPGGRIPTHLHDSIEHEQYVVEGELTLGVQAPPSSPASTSGTSTPSGTSPSASPTVSTSPSAPSGSASGGGTSPPEPGRTQAECTQTKGRAQSVSLTQASEPHPTDAPVTARRTAAPAVANPRTHRTLIPDRLPRGGRAVDPFASGYGQPRVDTYIG